MVTVVKATYEHKHIKIREGKNQTTVVYRGIMRDGLRTAIIIVLAFVLAALSVPILGWLFSMLGWDGTTGSNIGFALTILTTLAVLIRGTDTLSFNEVGITLRNRLYLWENYEGVIVSTYASKNDSSRHSYECGRISFKYGVKVIRIRPVWYDRLWLKAAEETFREMVSRYRGI